MRILLVTQYFWPENFRINDLVEGLLDLGHSVTVLTGVPNYPSGKIESGYGYFNLKSESYKGADVKRVPMLTRGKGSGLHLALNYLSFAVSASLLGPWLCRGQHDCIFVYGLSPTTVAIPAMVLKWLKRKPMVMWVQDLWPESLEATGFVKNQLVIGLVRRMVRMIYSSCDRILLSSRSFIPAVLSIHNRPEKLHYFPQWAERFYGPRPRDESYRDRLARGRSFCLTFAGNIGTAQDVETILECATLLRDHQAISFSLLGDGSMRVWLDQEIIKRGLNNIACLGGFPSSQMPDFFAASDVLLVSLKQNPLYSITVPAKVQSYLACGRPILASIDGEGARVILEAQSGRVCDPENPGLMKDTVLDLYKLFCENPNEFQEFGENGLLYAKQNFSRDTLLDELLEHLQNEKSDFVSENPGKYYAAVYPGRLKSVIDVFLSCLLIAMLFPVFLLVALLIYVDDPGTVLFLQERAGKHHQPFKIYKFRTMKLGTPSISTEEMRKSGIDPITKVGRILRRTSLDEIPQLINVIKGEMSLVGPRPALMSQTKVLEGRERTGSSGLLPGITGLAQALGRDDLEDDEKIAFDKTYAERISFGFDIYVCYLTIKALFSAKGAH